MALKSASRRLRARLHEGGSLLLLSTLVSCVSAATPVASESEPSTVSGEQLPSSAKEAKPLRVVLDEGEAWSYLFHPDPRGRVDLEGLPPGAELRVESAASDSDGSLPPRRLRFLPDFTQGGESWTVTRSGSSVLEIQVRDSIQPPAPTVVSTAVFPGFDVHRVAQVTDAFLDNAERAGRRLEAHVAVPHTQGPHPVRLHLHGFSPAPETLNFGSPSEIIVHPQDLENTYWWGYSDALPSSEGPSGLTPNYSQRRALHLLEWAVDEFGGDPQKIHVQGASMGGAGAATLGLLSARHFSWVDSRVGQMIARNHRPARIEQLGSLWGLPEQALSSSAHSESSVWDEMDLSRVLHQHPEAKEQFLFLKHSKDDAIIHFGAVTQPSPLTGESFYQSLQSQRVGHLAVWDEGGHMSPDPQLGSHWWDAAWDPTHDGLTYLRRDLAFPAFSNSSADNNPGTGSARDGRSWHPRKGYAGKHRVSGDTGWDGDTQGALGRFLRWDATQILDSFDRFEIPLRHIQKAGPNSAKVTVDVALRRRQRFRPSPGEALGFELGTQTGSVDVSSDGSVFIPGLVLTEEWSTLRVLRSE